MKHDFHVGDHVYIVNSLHFSDGTTATIVSLSGEYNLDVRVDISEPDHLCHSCRGLCEKGYGWTISYDRLRLTEVNNEDINITDTDLISILGGTYGL